MLFEKLQKYVLVMNSKTIKKTYWSFTVLDSTPVYDYKRHCPVVKCRCKCGTEVNVNVYTLKSGQSRCCRKCWGKTKVGNKNPNYRGVGSVPGRMLSRMKRRAEKMGMRFDLSGKYLQDLFTQQNKKCAITGLDISFDTNTASLDRIDSLNGYCENNVWWVHKDVNIMKNGYELDYFAFICQKVSLKKLKTISKTNFIYGK